MRALPVALLEVGARVSDLFTTVLARHRDVLLFRHAARITESCLECIRVSAGVDKGRDQRSSVDYFEYFLIPRMVAEGVKVGVVFDPSMLQLVTGVGKQAFQQIESLV